MSQPSIRKNFLMNAILTMSSFLFPLITFPYVSRILLPAGTGTVSFAASVVAYFNMFAQLGIPTYGIRACANHLDSAVIRGQLMVGVTKQRNGNAVFPGNPLRDSRNRTGIRVNINSQTITSQYLQRYPIQVVAGNQPVHDSVMPALDAVVETVLSMAVSINDLFHLIFLGHGGKITVPLHYIGGRIMQKHNEPAVPVFYRGFK